MSGCVCADEPGTFRICLLEGWLLFDFDSLRHDCKPLGGESWVEVNVNRSLSIPSRISEFPKCERGRNAL